MSKYAVDAQGIRLQVGQKVARASKFYAMNGGLFVTICEITRIDGNKVYLDGSPQPLRFPDRIAVVAEALI